MIWIAGTSVSIESGGYVTQLAALAAAQGLSLTNLSVGDETSLMGCMRVLSHGSSIAPGDVVVWEYSLLDALIGRNFVHADIREARRMAWEAVLDRRAHLVVIMSPPRKGMRTLSRHERETAADALELGQRCIDVRGLFDEAHVPDPLSQFRDDRHLRIDSPVVSRLARNVLDAVAERHGRDLPQRLLDRASDWRCRTGLGWMWIGADDLVLAPPPAPQGIANSLVKLRAVMLTQETRASLERPVQPVYVGTVSRVSSGALWCGHADCKAASTALPARHSHAFLARAIRLPCRRGARCLVAAPHGTRLQIPYGTAAGPLPGNVEIFGVLCGFSTRRPLMWRMCDVLLRLRTWFASVKA